MAISERLKVLFLCAKNKWRSPTCETIYRGDPRLMVRSAGVKQGARRYVTENDIEWADLIFVMEREHKKIIHEQFNHLHLPEIVVLDIPDEYHYMCPHLQHLIGEAVEPVLRVVLNTDDGERG